MNAALLAIVLGLGWIAITGGLTLPNLALGVVIAGFVIFLLRHHLRRPLAFRRAGAAVALALLFIKELFLSALTVARLAVTPGLRARLKPAIIAFPLTATSDAEITLLANLISLTPGTLTLDVAADRRYLHIHVLVFEGRESFVAAIATGFERKVMEVFR